MKDPGALDVLRRRIDEMERRHARELEELRATLEKMESADEPVAVETHGRAAVPPPLPVWRPAPAPEPVPELAQEPGLSSGVMAVEATSHSHAEEGAGVPFQGEVDFGRVWLVRIGVVILLAGLVFLGNYAYQNWIRDLGNGVRLAALLVLAGVWVETGRRLAARENLRRFGEVVMAGGLGFSYYCVYAAHHVGRLRVIDSAAVAGVLLVAAAAGIAAVAWRRDSRLTATLGMLLASFTTVVQPLGWLACVSNGALAAMGLFFLTRRGWAAPGWVGMLGMYGAFALWQVFGAAGRGGDALAVLWFLAPSWAVFAVAGVLPTGGVSLAPRVRAWFAGANNALFFILFGVLWIDHYGSGKFWMVAGTMGLALTALGVWGRRTLPVAGAANLAQGLLLLGLALVLKLDGYHLALAFAVEALVLAAAYRKFGGRVEAVGALLAAIAAAGWICMAENRPPLWSAGLAVVLLGAACLVMRLAAGFERRRAFRGFARGAAGAMFAAALAAFAIGVLWRMDRDWAHAAAAVSAFVLGWAALRLDRKRRMREMAAGAVALLVGAIAVLAFEALEKGVPWGVMPPMIVALLAGVWLWRTDEADVMRPIEFPPDDRRLPEWLSAAAAALAVWVACANSGITADSRVLVDLGGALGLAVAATLLRSGRLAMVSGALGLLVMLAAISARTLDAHPAWVFFTATPVALAALVVWFLPPGAGRVPDFGRKIGAAGFRVAAFLAWALAVYRAGGAAFIDGWAATAIVLMGVAMSARIKLPPESLLFLGLAVTGLIVKSMAGPWTRIETTEGWRGAWVLVAMFLLVFSHRERAAVIEDGARRAQVIAFLGCLAVVLTTVWTTQMMVWRAGWDGAVALWSVLGMLTVAAGLWQRLRGLRVAGLLLLLVALAKLFFHDVWDYTAFTRVVSFIALGIALILLGLFYNHFAETLRKWL